jgi:hypothetical protein
MDDSIGLEQNEEAAFADGVSDEMLERAAATGQARTPNPTVPGAIICLPFGKS